MGGISGDGVIDPEAAVAAAGGEMPDKLTNLLKAAARALPPSSVLLEPGRVHTNVGSRGEAGEACAGEASRRLNLDVITCCRLSVRWSGLVGRGPWAAGHSSSDVRGAWRPSSW